MKFISRRGVTLIELAIVLVVIGLMVGGVVAGKTLIRASQLKNILAQQQRYLAAEIEYKNKYDQIPGDHSNAESFFGASATNNGNGDGTINNTGGLADHWLFWQHLALAGLIEGNYTGANGPDTSSGDVDAVIGTNVPGSAIPGVGFSIIYSLTDTDMGELPPGHAMLVGRDINDSSVNLTYGPWITTREAYGIDRKVDDSRANTGKFRIHPGGAHGLGSCTSGAAPNYSYSLSLATQSCSVYFLFSP